MQFCSSSLYNEEGLQNGTFAKKENESSPQLLTVEFICNMAGIRHHYMATTIKFHISHLTVRRGRNFLMMLYVLALELIFLILKSVLISCKHTNLINYANVRHIIHSLALPLSVILHKRDGHWQIWQCSVMCN